MSQHNPKHTVFAIFVIVAATSAPIIAQADRSEQARALEESRSAIDMGNLQSAREAADRAHELEKTPETMNLRADLEIAALELDKAEKLAAAGDLDGSERALEAGLVGNMAGLYRPLSKRLRDHRQMMETGDRSLDSGALTSAGEAFQLAQALIDTSTVRARLDQLQRYDAAVAAGDAARAAGKIDEASAHYDEAARILKEGRTATPEPTPPPPPIQGDPVPPPGTVTPVKRRSISAANAMFEDAHRLRKSLNVLDLRDDWLKSLDRYDEIIRTWPDSDKVPDSYFYGGRVLEKLDRNRKAIEYFEMAVKLGCTDPVDAYMRAAEVADDDLDDSFLARRYLELARSICTDDRLEKIHKKIRKLND